MPPAAVPAPARPTPPWTFAALLAGLAMLGPFSVDTYLPAFPEMARDLRTGPLEIQQTLTVYLFTYAVLSLWHGTVSDAIGRKPVILATLGIYAFASLGCAIAGNVQSLLLFRTVQGMAAGGGLIVGRAIIRDLYGGPDAQRLMARITLMFSAAPAFAPVVGGWLLTIAGWRSIFWVLVVFTLAMLVWTARSLRESHPVAARTRMHPKRLLEAYVGIFARRDFQLLAGMLAFNFAGFFLFIPSAPVWLAEQLHLSAQGFGWLFIPSIAGIVAGATISGRRAGRYRPTQTIALGYVLIGTAALLNVICAWTLPPGLPWTIAPLPLYSCGMSLIMPSATLLLLDLFPRARGLAPSAQGFTHIMLASVVAGAIAPLLQHSMRALSGGMLLFSALGFLYWTMFRNLHPGGSRPETVPPP